MIDSNKKISCLFRPKDKTFRWKFDGDDTVRLPFGNGIYPVCEFFY
jgi:hypothetical protein